MARGPGGESSMGESVAMESVAVSEPQTKEAGIERRAYQRLRTRLPIRYRKIDIDKEDKRQVANAGEPDARGHTRDISANVIGFLAEEKLMPGEVLDLRIRIPDGGDEIECIGRVVRVNHESTLANFSSVTVNMVVLTFLAIPSPARSRLERFCKANPADEPVLI